MRFARIPRAAPYRVTGRKLAALLRRQRLEREAQPLFAPLIRERQQPPAAVFRQRAVQWTEGDQRRRDQRAAKWREVRARFYAMEPELRQRFRRAWNMHGCPADPAYFGDLMHSMERGHVDFAPDGRLCSRRHIEWLARQATIRPLRGPTAEGTPA